MGVAIVPPSRPGIAPTDARALLLANNVPPLPVSLIGIRGYYLDTMGEKGKNDRGIYDDAIILVLDKEVITYNANVDPSVGRTGIAVLRPGLWWYQIGIHGLNKPEKQRYKALVQRAKVTIDRDGGVSETGMFGINIHRGSLRSTSSLGCQTIYPPEWPGFIQRVEEELTAAGQIKLPYLLIDETARKQAA